MSAPTKPRIEASLLRNWISLLGIIVTLCAFLSVAFLIAMDLMAESSNPYMGILTYMVAPGFLIFGLTLIVFGAWRERRQRRHLAPGTIPPHSTTVNLPKPSWWKPLRGILGRVSCYTPLGGPIRPKPTRTVVVLTCLE